MEWNGIESVISIHVSGLYDFPSAAGRDVAYQSNLSASHPLDHLICRSFSCRIL